ncbi:MAG: hypothetical protein Q9190_007361 [Brigantiaea leucoxantha]
MASTGPMNKYDNNANHSRELRDTDRLSKIREKFAPKAETIEAVGGWLTESGIDPSRIELSSGRNWMMFNASVGEVESLLQTKYNYYTHASGQGHIACDEYRVPQSLSKHIDFIMPTVHFDTKIIDKPGQDQKAKKRDVPTNHQPGDPSNIAWNPKKGKTIASPNSPSPGVVYNLANCNQYITPECLRALYNFSNGTLAKSSYGIVEYTPQAYLQSDLNLFYANLARQIPSGTAPTFDSIDGGVDQTSMQGFNYQGESDLDLEYAIALGKYMKLGLAGVTILYSSGDYGVAGNGGQSFPGTCPYVTSVGATQIKPGASVTAPEEACETVIYSGGGFSNVFPIPSYQKSAVSSYFANHNPPYTATQYNNSRTVRGYPDVAANGANYVVAVDGQITLIYGTSASSPTFGSIITLINEQRVNSGKKAVGFINPTIYANPTAFNDIVTGGNQGCGTAGFTAVSGWDPVTGLGTPNYAKLLSVFQALA